jgi:hypothetical protein
MVLQAGHVGQSSIKWRNKEISSQFQRLSPIIFLPLDVLETYSLQLAGSWSNVCKGIWKLIWKKINIISSEVF